MRKYVTVLFLVSGVLANAQTKSNHQSPPLSEAAPQSVGMSEERLKRIDAMLEKAVSEEEIPGAVALVARNGKIVYWKAFGMADNQAGKPLRKDDVFRIASMTKAVTSTAVMMLWEEGLFRLDDPISKYIPVFNNPEVFSGFLFSDTSYTTIPANSEFTIRQLLIHTSGLGYGQIDKDERFKMIHEKAGVVDLFTTGDISLEENIQRIATLPLHHHPGEGYTYSLGYEVLAYFVEVMSGITFEQFLTERIFRPVGMNDSWLYLPDDQAHRLVTVQTKNENGEWIPYPETFYDPDFPVKGAKRYFSGGAGVCCTAKDYATFMQLILNGGEINGIRILSRTTLHSMLSDQMQGLRGDDLNRNFGLAFSVTNERGVAEGGMGSAGSLAGAGYFNTNCYADQKDGYIGILMKQTRDLKSDDTGWKYRVLLGQAVDD
jgi:CubicO group peptidase (beta-lactamase class C family)